MSSESYVQAPTDGTGKKLRTVKSTIGTDEVHNEGVIVVDPTTPTQVMTVDADGNAQVKANPGVTYDHYHYNGSTDNQTIAAAVVGKVTKVHYISLQVQGTVTVSLEDGSGGTKIWQFKGQDREGIVSGFVPYPAHICQTTANTALVLDLGAAVTVDITVIYSDEDAS